MVPSSMTLEHVSRSNRRRCVPPSNNRCPSHMFPPWWKTSRVRFWPWQRFALSECSLVDDVVLWCWRRRAADIDGVSSRSPARQVSPSQSSAWEHDADHDRCILNTIPSLSLRLICSLVFHNAVGDSFFHNAVWASASRSFSYHLWYTGFTSFSVF